MGACNLNFAFETARRPIAERQPAIDLPLVSVVITNFNYGAYIRQAVESVMTQTYPTIECIIVDDCSTDDSIEVIRELKQDFPSLRVLLNEKNSGQSISVLNGFRQAGGAYVIFLDADDYLFPDCVSAHIRAHLSLRVAVGVTSVDMVQLLDGRFVTTTSQGFSEFVRSGVGLGQNIFRAFDHPFPATGDFSRVTIEENSLHYVHPSNAQFWPWSPTSGNCFRREALDLIMNNERFTTLRSCTDIYLLRGVAALTGSVLIDHPLAAYRLHGSNDFIKTATIHRIRVYSPDYLEQRSAIAMAMIIDHIIENAASLAHRLESRHYLIEALNALGESWPPIIDAKFGPGYLGRQIILHRRLLLKALGATLYNDWLLSHLTFWKGKSQKRNVFTFLAGSLIGVFVLPIVCAMADRGYIFGKTR
jgi:glycosyltransferase involved in cell wall biosynthesis